MQQLIRSRATIRRHVPSGAGRGGIGVKWRPQGGLRQFEISDPGEIVHLERGGVNALSDGGARSSGCTSGSMKSSPDSRKHRQSQCLSIFVARKCHGANTYKGPVSEVMSPTRTYGNASERAAEKQRSRDADARAVETGEKTREQLRVENSHFHEIAHEPIQWDKMRRI